MVQADSPYEASDDCVSRISPSLTDDEEEEVVLRVIHECFSASAIDILSFGFAFNIRSTRSLPSTETVWYSKKSW